MRKALWMLSLLIASTGAHAAWLEASSDHFVVYGDTTEENLRRFAEQLERYDAAMSVITGTPRRKPSPSARVTIYATGGDDELRELAAQNGRVSRNIAGFYIPAMAGPVAFVPRIAAARKGDEDLDFSTIVLLHEYAHHFAFINSRFTPPLWYTEGSAEPSVYQSGGVKRLLMKAKWWAYSCSSTMVEKSRSSSPLRAAAILGTNATGPAMAGM